MSNLITLKNISLDFGSQLLLDKADLTITSGERVCLIGRNGEGKSSLLKLIDGTVSPDGGTIQRKPNLRLGRLTQELPEDYNETVFEFVAQGLAEVGKLLTEYHQLTHSLSASESQYDLDKLTKLQQQIDLKEGWQIEQKIAETLTRLNLDPDVKLTSLSGGWQRRAALAQALVTSPELLLLDEPTNHLDIETIQWLEEQLLDWNIGLLFVTHDRALLQRLATRILELDRGQLTSWPGDYQNFLRRKQERLHAEEKENAEFDKKLAQEEKWIRQGIQARRTRNEGRVRALKALRVERSQRREQQSNVNLSVDDNKKSGKLVLEANTISHEYNQTPIIKNLSIRILRGDRIGLIGPNGVGKSTLLNILLKKLQPQQGSVKHGSQLNIAYFDQMRQNIEPEKTVADNITQGQDFIEINGQKKHIVSYLSDFLFTPARAQSLAKCLSGGEANRLLLARLFSQPANLLVLDEPTNDLDIETLELLESLLCEYQGTLLLVSHDRSFLDNVVTSTLAFEGNGIIKEYIGGYQDWLRQKQSVPLQIKSKKTKAPDKAESKTQVNKLCYEERKELQKLPKQIEKLETELEKVQQKIAAPDFYQQTVDVTSATLTQLKELEEKLEKVYTLWEELEARL